MNTSIPDAAIEAGARVLAGLDEGESWPSNAELGGGPTGTRDDEFRNGLREEATDVLTAALPHLHPVIETVEQLDALPNCSLVRSIESETVVEVNDGRILTIGSANRWPVDSFASELPATVLHMGGDDA